MTNLPTNAISPHPPSQLTPSMSSSEILGWVKGEVANADIIDLHTHLLPSTHGMLHLRGIDELLTYHYLIAEYFLTAPVSVTPEVLYGKTKQRQAEMVWEALFVSRSPMSEATRGVCTVLQRLGLGGALRRKDLGEIREVRGARPKRGAEQETHVSSNTPQPTHAH